MATDYVSLLTRAIQTLESDSAETRCDIYDRARRMVETSLRARMPPASETSIKAEQATLEEAIWQVEMSASKPQPRHATQQVAAASSNQQESPDIHVRKMRYVRSVLQPGERILARGKYHWIVYVDALLFLLVGLVLFSLKPNSFQMTDNMGPIITFVSIVLIALAPISAFGAWFKQWTTEIAVTTFRVIHKSGFIRRRTWEMNMDKIESVTVDQSIPGRLLGYGTVHVLGTGVGAEHLHQISSPIDLRNRIVAR